MVGSQVLPSARESHVRFTRMTSKASHLASSLSSAMRQWQETQHEHAGGAAGPAHGLGTQNPWGLRLGCCIGTKGIRMKHGLGSR